MPPSVLPALQALQPTQYPNPQVYNLPGPESNTSPGSQIPDQHRSGTTYDLRVGFEVVAALLKEVHRRQGFPNRDTCALTSAMAPPNRLAGKFEKLPHTSYSTQAVGLFLVSKPFSVRPSTTIPANSPETSQMFPLTADTVSQSASLQPAGARVKHVTRLADS